MMSVVISDAVSNISVRYIEEAADFVTTSKERKPVWLKWAAAAACIVLIISFVLLLYPGEIASKTLSAQLAEYGLSAEEVKTPEFTSSGIEMPYLPKEDLLRIIQNSNTVHGRIQDNSYVKVVNGNECLYIAQFTIEVIDVIFGDVEENPVTIVSACCYINDSGERLEFPIEEALWNCTEGMESIFVLRRVEDGSTWNIGGTDIDTQSLGTYFLSLRLDEENGQFICNGIAVTLEEISNKY